MTFYWTAKSLPELADRPHEECQRILAATAAKPLRHWRYRATLLGAFLIFMLLSLLALPVLQERVSSRGLRVLIFFAVLAPVVLFLRHVGYHLTRPYIREYLRGEHSSDGHLDA